VTDGQREDGVARVFLHVGTMKTGTTYLQSRFNLHRFALEGVGVRYPRHQMHAMRDYLGRRGTIGRPDVTGAWASLLAELRHGGAHTGIMSMEYLSTSQPDRIADVVAELRPADVHVIVTVRDLARVMPAQWQETIQNQATWTWAQYADGITTKSPDESEAASKFWRQHDVARIVGDWSAVVGPDHMHLVTVPPSDASPDLLWNRFLDVVGLDGAQFPAEEGIRRANTGVDAASAEFLRRLNARVGRTISTTAYIRHVKQLLGKDVLVGRSGGVKPVFTPEQHAWVVSYSDRLIDHLRDTGIEVSGTLDDLRPAPYAVPADDEAGPTDAAISDVATDVVLALLKRLDEQEVTLDDEAAPLVRRRPRRGGAGRESATPDAGGPTTENDRAANQRRRRARMERRAAQGPQGTGQVPDQEA
jgi:hypothetical protein